MKQIYDFSEGNASMKELLGGKGANLAEMSGLKIPVPPGFTITTKVCAEYSKLKKSPKGLVQEVEKYLVKLEKKMGKKLGDSTDPLLVSVRSGAAVSMPGMMDTVLNLGMNDKSVLGLAQVSGNERFAWDAYRRFISMYGTTAKGVDKEDLDHAFDKIKAKRTAKSRHVLSKLWRWPVNNKRDPWSCVPR